MALRRLHYRLAVQENIEHTSTIVNRRCKRCLSTFLTPQEKINQTIRAPNALSALRIHARYQSYQAERKQKTNQSDVFVSSHYSMNNADRIVEFLIRHNVVHKDKIGPNKSVSMSMGVRNVV
jgi:hypothetical protein